MRYQLIVGENIGVGDVARFDDEARWREAAERAWRQPFVDDAAGRLPHAARQVVRRTGASCRSASGRRSRSSRAFMRARRRHPRARRADRGDGRRGRGDDLRALPRADRRTQIAILISHRFSTVRMADQIVVLEDGRIVERGTHEELVRANGRYARLFKLQAAVINSLQKGDANLFRQGRNKGTLQPRKRLASPFPAQLRPSRCRRRRARGSCRESSRCARRNGRAPTACRPASRAGEAY